MGMRKTVDDVALWNVRAGDVMHLGRFLLVEHHGFLFEKEQRHSGWMNQFQIHPLGLEYLYTTFLYLHLPGERYEMT